ncbi:hypothetical protein AAULR_18896 [Lacticaseibacillus rhamnosus MTCC 5462]|nr:hypothetical protein AAULR_18896 [Lacticaseibacillus rhamnosus MTCC 5462]
MIVDGYNVIGNWPELAKLKQKIISMSPVIAYWIFWLNTAVMKMRK